MTKQSTLLLTLFLAIAPLANAQNPAPLPAPIPSPGHRSTFNENLVRLMTRPEDQVVMPQFDLDFPGGTPKQLVDAINKAPKRWPTNAPFGNSERGTINVIIPNDCSRLTIPAIAVKDVDVVELFAAIGGASREQHMGMPGQGSYTTSYGFRSESDHSHSIWYFYWDRPLERSSVCRFYQLGPYLDAGLKVEDITTAIETAWKMLGISPQPDIKYHKDTKLLIAVGQAEQLTTIDDALRQLSYQFENRHRVPMAPMPAPLPRN